MCLSRVIQRPLTASRTCIINSTKTVIYFNGYITPRTIFSSPISFVSMGMKSSRRAAGGASGIFQKQKKRQKRLRSWTIASFSTAWWVCEVIISTPLGPSITRSVFNHCPSFPPLVQQACAVSWRRAFSSLHLDCVLVTRSVLVSVIGLLFWREGF